MDAFIQIPKTMSTPADPSAPSPLTSLPPEMRNAVYEVLFKRDELVLIHNAEAYHSKPPDRSECADDKDFQPALAAFDRCYDSEIGYDTEFYHGFGLGIPLILACRQLCHEASRVFYKSNIFTISRALN